MLLKSCTIYVFELTNTVFEPIGEVNKYTSLIWPDAYNGYALFELYTPVTEENREMLQQGRVVWCGGDNAAIIEVVQADTNSKGQKVYIIKGRTLETILTKRIVWGSYNGTNKVASSVMYDLVDQNCVNPSSGSRKIPFLECAPDAGMGNLLPSYQKTGGEVYDALFDLASESDLGFSILFRPMEKKLIFQVQQGVDRSNMPTSAEGPIPVILSTDLEDILSSSYYTNNQDIKSMAFVAGEGEGADRSVVLSGDTSSEGFLRSELYVDAKDIRSETTDEEGNTKTLTETEYAEALDTRGNQKLAEHKAIENFEAQIRVSGGQYTYGVDYTKGDKVLIQDFDLGVQVVGRITEACENYGANPELVLTFGYAYPTLIRKIKQQLS